MAQLAVVLFVGVAIDDDGVGAVLRGEVAHVRQSGLGGEAALVVGPLFPYRYASTKRRFRSSE